MSEHHHSLKKETFHENKSPFVSSANQIDSVLKGRTGRQERKREREDEMEEGGWRLGLSDVREKCEFLAGDQFGVSFNNGQNFCSTFDFTRFHVKRLEAPLHLKKEDVFMRMCSAS